MKTQKSSIRNMLFAALMTVAMFFTNVGTVFVYAQEMPQETKIVILHTNDMHGRVDPGKYDGMGLAKVATLVKQYKESNPNTLVLDAGDAFHGTTVATIVKGESMAKIMDAIGYDAMAAGNHDFNYGQDRLLELDKMTKFPILSANVIKKNGKSLLTPYIIKEMDGIKVGIFGLSTPDTAYMTHPRNVKGLTFEDPAKEAKKVVAELEKKADVIIGVTHLGTDDVEYSSIKVAQQVEGIDVIIDGHTHTVLPEGKMVGKTLIASTGEYDKNLGVVELTVKDKKVTDKKANLILKDEIMLKSASGEFKDDEAIATMIGEIKKEQEKVLSEVVGKTTVKLDGERANVRTGETNMGNLITDAMIAMTGADVAITNGGGIRASIEAGDITKKDIVTVLPFGNYIVTKNVSGADIKEALEHGVSAYPEQKGAFPHVGGMKYSIDPSKPVGERIESVRIKEQPLDLNKMYLVATNDFMAAGGDGYEMLGDDEIANEFPALDEALIEYIQNNEGIEPKIEGRVIVKAVALEEAITKPEPVKNDKIEEVENNKVEEIKSAKTTVYIVRSGDVLWKIAQKYETTWETLQQMNELKNPHLIFPGDQLKVPTK